MLNYLKNVFGVMGDNKGETSSSSYSRDVCFRSNGLLLSNLLIPEEIITIILSFLPWKDLLPCRLVCQTWKDIVDISVRREKMKSIDLRNLLATVDSSNYCASNLFGHLPFYVNYTIGTKFGKNLLKNPFGNVNKFNNWHIVSSGGDGWAVEEVPLGCEPLPDHLEGKSCFVTSFRKAYKRQLICLHNVGLHSKIMDEIQPDIKISEWYATRFDCGSIYSVKVCLLNKHKQVVAEFVDEQRLDLWQAQVWNEISHTFSNYGPGVRYILFAHGGCDTQFWKGHYGSKMAGGKVVALVPQRILRKMSNSS